MMSLYELNAFKQDLKQSKSSNQSWVDIEKSSKSKQNECLQLLAL